jgi:hypothetical protein
MNFQVGTSAGQAISYGVAAPGECFETDANHSPFQV